MNRIKIMIKRHPEILLFGMIAAIYTICCAPDLTWINVNCDSFYYFTGAAYLTDWGAQPLYKLLGHLALMFPLGADGWKLAFFCSVIPAIITVILIFYVIRKQTNNRYAPYIGSLAFAASVVIISQATVQDLYSMATMFIMGAYLAAMYNKSKTALILMGLGFLTHWITVIPSIAALVLWRRDLLKRSYILAPFILAPFILTHFFSNYSTLSYWGSLLNLLFTVPLDEIPQRILDTVRIVIVVGALAWLPAWLYLREWRRSYPFLIIIGVPILYLLTCFAIDGYVQMYIGTAFLAVAAGLGVDKLKTRHLEKVILGFSCVMLLIIPAFWDIGRTIDESPTTARQWIEQIKETPNGSIILCVRYLDGQADTVGAMARSAVEIASAESGREYHYLFPSYYIIEDDRFGERERLRDLGFQTPNYKYNGESYNDFEKMNLEAFVKANNNKCYYTIVTKPEVFGCELVEWK